MPDFLTFQGLGCTVPLSACLSLFSFCCQTATPFLPRLRCLMAHVSISPIYLSHSLIPHSFTHSFTIPLHLFCLSITSTGYCFPHALLWGWEANNHCFVFCLPPIVQNLGKSLGSGVMCLCFVFLVSFHALVSHQS